MIIKQFVLLKIWIRKKSGKCLISLWDFNMARSMNLLHLQREIAQVWVEFLTRDETMPAVEWAQMMNRLFQLCNEHDRCLMGKKVPLLQMLQMCPAATPVCPCWTIDHPLTQTLSMPWSRLPTNYNRGLPSFRMGRPMGFYASRPSCGAPCHALTAYKIFILF